MTFMFRAVFRDGAGNERVVSFTEANEDTARAHALPLANTGEYLARLHTDWTIADGVTDPATGKPIPFGP